MSLQEPNPSSQQPPFRRFSEGRPKRPAVHEPAAAAPAPPPEIVRQAVEPRREAVTNPAPSDMQEIIHANDAFMQKMNGTAPTPSPLLATPHPPAAPVPAARSRRNGRQPDAQTLVIPADDAGVAALLDEASQMVDPWKLLLLVQRGLEERTIALSNLGAFARQFYLAVAMQPKDEEDRLLHAGRSTFQYQTEQARDEVKKLRVTGNGKVVTSFANDDLLADIVYKPGEVQPVQFLMYHRDGTTEPADQLQVGVTTLYPPSDTNFLETGAVLLPSGIAEYGSDRALRERIRAYLARTVKVEHPHFLAVGTTYVFMSWVFDRFRVLPYLRFLGESGGGKSRAVEALGRLSYRGMLASGAASSAALFRTIDKFQGTLTIDEADLRNSDLTADFVKIMNVGNQLGGAVWRCEGEQHEPRCFPVFGPKIFGARQPFEDHAVEGRCLTFDMNFKGKSVDLPKDISLIFTAEMAQEAAALRDQLLLWRFRHWREIEVDPFERFPGLDPRLNQIVLPLLAVVDDPETREALLAYAQRIGQVLQEKRSETGTARVLALMGQMIPTAKQSGWWGVDAATDYLNTDAGGHPVPEKERIARETVGRTMRNLGFTYGRVPGTGRARYKWDAPLLLKHLAEWDLDIPDTLKTELPRERRAVTDEPVKLTLVKRQAVL